MSPWLETTGVVLLALLGIFAGHRISRLRRPHWAWGYFISLALIALLLVATYISLRVYIPLLAWISAGRTRFIILCLSVTLGSTTLIGRLRRQYEKMLVSILMVAVVIWSSVLPFLLPALMRNDLKRLPTVVTSDDVCLQSTDYTCGPAAAVTALRRLGLHAHEGEIAVLSHTNPIGGTMPWSLYKAIQSRYADTGVDCQFRYFESIDQLRQAPAALVVIRDAFLLDHCVAVLDVSEDMVTLADPVLGRLRMSHKQFEQIWRFYAIVLSRNQT